VTDEDRLTVATIDALVGRLRGVCLRLDQRFPSPSRPEDAFIVGNAANVLDRMSMLYLLHDSTRVTIDAAIATQPAEGSAND